MKIKLDERLASMRRQRDDANMKFKEIQLCSGDVWEELKQGVEEVWFRLKEALTRTNSQFD